MWESVLTLLTLAVFGCLWLASQDWFDLLPRLYARRLSGVLVVVLGVTCYAAPSAFQAGFKKWSEHVAAEATQRTRDMLKAVTDRLAVPSASPTPTPSPTGARPPLPMP